MQSAFAQDKRNSRLRPTLGKAFSGERLHRAMDYLGFKVRNRNVAQACEELEKIVAEQRKYLLFKQVFSHDWKTSKASFFKKGFYENYSERENEFFGLVNEKLFPLLSGWNEDPESEFEEFSIYPLNLDLCCEDFDYEELRVSFVAALLFLFRDDEIWEFFSNKYGITRTDFPEINERPHDDIWTAESPKSAGHYRNIFEIVDHSTGNPWLDTTTCNGGATFGWDEENLRFLSDSFQNAQEMLEKTSNLDELFEADPKAVLYQMIMFWNLGTLPEEEPELSVNYQAT